MILSMGRWVLREACLQARIWQQAGLLPIVVAVNTSVLEFRAKDFLDNIRAVLKETCLEPRYLELELTESVLMQDAGPTDSILHTLADLGVKLSIDDFGTGYSSLSYLRQFPIDTLKIDQSFVNQMCSNPDDAAIVSAVISMGKNLKKRVIAEDIETREQYEFSSGPALRRGPRLLFWTSGSCKGAYKLTANWNITYFGLKPNSSLADFHQNGQYKRMPDVSPYSSSARS